MRRNSIAIFFLLAAACGGGGGHGGAAGDPFATLHRIAVGDVDDQSAMLWALPARTGTLRFELSTDPGFANLAGTYSVTVVDAAIPAKAEAAGLLAGTRYYVRATGRAAGPALAARFRTAFAADAGAGAHFGVGGDARGDMAPFPSIRNAADLDLDFFVELGDTIYADVASPDVPVAQATTLAQFRAKHAENVSARSGFNTIARLRESTAVLAMIDDHEVIDDFAGGADPLGDPRFPSNGEAYINDTSLFETGLQAFLEYQPVRVETYVGTGVPSVDGERKLYRFRTFGRDAAVMMLDTRSFRSQMLSNPDPLDSASVAQFRSDAFNPARTMLGGPQLADLEDDLLAAEALGITWKFVLVPEPIQNLGPGNPRDRFEGYAYERSRLLAFIHDNDLRNVVFVTADIHGTVVNNLQYQATGSADPQIDVDSFEISTPPIAYDPPLGQDAVNSVTLTPVERAAYEAMSMDAKDDFFRSILDAQLGDEGYDSTGLDGSSLDATLLEGKWIRAHTFGWCEFEIDAGTKALTVTTWGIEPYSPSEAAGAASRVPAVLGRFRVTPKPAGP